LEKENNRIEMEERDWKMEYHKSESGGWHQEAEGFGDLKTID
jgi:hypothetical protein